MSHRTVERWLTILIAGLVATVLLGVMTSQAGPKFSGRAVAAEAFMLDLVNEARDEHGLAPLAPAADVAEVAWQWSVEMSVAGSVEHNPDFGTQVCCWEVVTENVAFSQPHGLWLPGDPVERVTRELHEALLASPGHRANILHAGVDEVGIGIHVDPRGSVWVTQNYRRLVAD